MTRINITDDMIERVVRVLQSETRPGQDDDFARWILESALNRRTGPKDRRVEINDVMPPRPTRRLFNYHGRRDGDRPWVLLPRKSDRLKREAEAKEQEIHVSEGMRSVGGRVCQEEWLNTTHTFEECAETIHRAMRLQEMKERGGA